MGSSSERNSGSSLTLPVLLRPEAQDEVRDAYEWYEASVPGLGERFLAELHSIVSLISKNPALFPPVFGFRRAVVDTFPYCIYFREAGSAIVVVAVFHGRRDPKRLRKRK